MTRLDKESDQSVEHYCIYCGCSLEENELDICDSCWNAGCNQGRW